MLFIIIFVVQMKCLVKLLLISFGTQINNVIFAFFYEKKKSNEISFLLLKIVINAIIYTR